MKALNQYTTELPEWAFTAPGRQKPPGNAIQAIDCAELLYLPHYHATTAEDRERRYRTLVSLTVPV